MPPQDASSSKQVAKKGSKKTPILSFESTVLSNSSSDYVEYPIKGKANPRGKRPTRVKKVATMEDAPPWGPRMKNSSTFPSHSPLPSEIEDDV